MVLPRSLVLACVLVCASVVGQVPKVDAFNVLGCNFNPGDNPESCINGKINEQVNQAKNEMNAKVNDANKKAQDAQRQADAARQELQNSPFLARLRGEQQILQAVRSLQIEPLMQCLESARASGRTDVAQYIQRLNGNPGEFTKWLVEDIWRLLEVNFDQVMAEELQGLRNPSARVFQQMADPGYAIAKIRRVADKHEAARCLVQQLSPRLPDLQRSAGELQATTRARMEALYQQRLKPLVDDAVGKGLRAALNASMQPAQLAAPARAPQPTPAVPSQLPPPPAPPAKDTQSSTAPTQQAPQTFQQIPSFPNKAGGIRSRGLEEGAEGSEGEIGSRGIKDAASYLPGPGKVVDIANGVLAEYLLKPAAVHQSADRVHQLAVALDSPNRQGVPAAAAAVKTSLDNTFQLPGIAYLDIGLEIIRYMGHTFIDSEQADIDLGAGLAIPPGGAFMVEAALKAASSAANSIDQTVGGVCGLVPEIGAGACNVGLWVVDKGWEWGGRFAIKQAALFGMNKSYDGFIDLVKDRMHRDQGYGSTAVMDDLRRQAGPLAPVLDNLQKEAILKLADSYIKETRLAIEHYNISVRELAEASARAR